MWPVLRSWTQPPHAQPFLQSPQNIAKFGICSAFACAEEMLAMRMIAKAGGLIVLLVCHGLCQSYSETTRASAQRNDGQSSFYYWKSESVAGTAQFLTLFCRSCGFSNDGGRDVPLVSVLRDILLACRSRVWIGEEKRYCPIDGSKRTAVSNDGASRGRLIQWTAFDPLGGPVRASTHAYRSSASDDERRSGWMK
jgi:hypothetical protein